jgi:superfamily I DNA and/or RNA helicase
MSHYRGQVAAIRRRLGTRYRNRGVAVRTVHRTQGAEASTAILDLTLTPQQPTRVSSVFTAVRPEQDGSRLLAVAASRPRSRLIILGDFEWIERSVAAETVLGRICAHLLEEGQEITVGEVRHIPTASPSLVLR